MCVWTKKRGSMNAVVLMATPCPKSLHGKGEKWIARNILQCLDSRQPMTAGLLWFITEFVTLSCPLATLRSPHHASQQESARGIGGDRRGRPSGLWCRRRPLPPAAIRAGGIHDRPLKPDALLAPRR